MASFYDEFCDTMYSYRGCTVIGRLVVVDNILIGFLALLWILSLFNLAFRFYTHGIKGGKRLTYFNQLDQISVVGILGLSFQMAYLYSLRIIDSADAQRSVVLSMILGIATVVLGSLMANLFLLVLVKSTTDAALITPIKIRGRDIDMPKFMKLLRLVIMILLISVVVRHAQSPDAEAFRANRRIAIIIFAVVTWCVSAPIMLFFGFRLIRHMKHASLSVRGTKPSPGPASKELASLPVSITKADETQKKAIFKMHIIIVGVAFACYGSTGLHLIVYLISSELFQTQQQYFIVAKVVSALCFIAAFALPSLYPLYFVFRPQA